MSLAIMNEVRGEDYAQAVMLDMEYDPAPPVNGGTPEKTKPSVQQMMLSMYDKDAQPLIDSLEKQMKNKARINKLRFIASEVLVNINLKVIHN